MKEIRRNLAAAAGWLQAAMRRTENYGDEADRYDRSQAQSNHNGVAAYHIQVEQSDTDEDDEEEEERDDACDGGDAVGQGHSCYGAGHSNERTSTRERYTASQSPYLSAHPLSSYSKLEHHPVATFVLTLSVGWLLGLFYVWPYPTTIHAILPLAIASIAWTVIQWASLIQAAFHSSKSRNKWTRSRRIAVLLSSILTLAIALNAIPPSERRMPLPSLVPSNPSIPERYFIAANLYNNEDIIPEWTEQLIKLCEHREY